jgi:hypothetical protein
MGILAFSVYQIRQIKGTLQTIQYDDKNVTLYTLSFACFLVVGIIIPLSIVVDKGSLTFDSRSDEITLWFFICVMVFNFVCMLMLAKLFNTVINRAVECRNRLNRMTERLSEDEEPAWDIPQNREGSI